MTYLFSGIFSKQAATKPYLPDSNILVFRDVPYNQLQSGALFPSQNEDQIDTPNQDTFELIYSLKELGITEGFWIYYCCWGGKPDVLAAAKFSESKIKIDSYCFRDSMEYADLPKFFNKLGVKIEDNGNFKPFVRNYWGKYGY